MDITPPRIDIVTTCMGRLSHLQQSLPLALAQPNVNCIVVDYSCPNNSGDWVRAHHPEVTVVDVPDQMHFSAATARNLGAGHSDPGSRYFCESLFWASKPKQTAKTSRDRLCLRRPDRPAYVA